MALYGNSANRIKDLLLSAVRDKLITYKPETNQMPFHYRLLGKDRMAMFSFIQSMNTTFGTSLWEQIAVILAEERGVKCQRQFKLKGKIDTGTEEFIDSLMHDLRAAKLITDKDKEILAIKNKIIKAEPTIDPDSQVDFFMIDKNVEYFVEIKTAKPNMDIFAAAKRKLLRWVALRFSQAADSELSTILAIPYNPYEPKPYERWTLRGLFDLDKFELLVGKEFWNFVADSDIYDDLLEQFQIVGNLLRNEIDEYFSRYK